MQSEIENTEEYWKIDQYSLHTHIILTQLNKI